MAQGSLAFFCLQGESCSLGQPHTARSLVFPLIGFYQRLSPQTQARLNRRAEAPTGKDWTFQPPFCRTVSTFWPKSIASAAYVLHLHPGHLAFCLILKAVIYKVVGFEFYFSHFIRMTRATGIMKAQHSLCEYTDDGLLKHLHRCSELCSSHPCHQGPKIYFELHKVPHSCCSKCFKNGGLLSRASTSTRRATWHCGASLSVFHTAPKYSQT